MNQRYIVLMWPHEVFWAGGGAIRSVVLAIVVRRVTRGWVVREPQTVHQAGRVVAERAAHGAAQDPVLAAERTIDVAELVLVTVTTSELIQDPRGARATRGTAARPPR